MGSGSGSWTLVPRAEATEDDFSTSQKGQKDIKERLLQKLGPWGEEEADATRAGMVVKRLIK